MSFGLGAARMKLSPPGAGKPPASIWGSTNRSAYGGFWGSELKQGEALGDSKAVEQAVQAKLQKGDYAAALAMAVNAAERGVKISTGLWDKVKELAASVRKKLRVENPEMLLQEDLEPEAALRQLGVALDRLEEYYSYIGIDRNQTQRSGTGGGGVIFNEMWARLVRGLDQPGLDECAAALADVKEMLGSYLMTAGASGGISGMKTRYAGFSDRGGGGR